ncbi:MAG TPA: hypothetical protein VF465_00240 [Flavobacterium sp.]|uniref:hypothetical protein n=1 Tax=Flavobacterium sp. TaxID=239 RepID=UPI002ED3C490
MEDLAKKRFVIDVYLTPTVDAVYTGMCLIANLEIIMLLSFDEEKGEFDGFTIVKNNDVEKYRTWNRNDYLELKNDNSKDLIEKIDLDKFLDIKSSLKSLTSKLVTLFTYGDEDSFYLAKILSVKNDCVELLLVDQYSVCNEIKVIKINDISYIGFDTQYERKYSKVLQTI